MKFIYIDESGNTGFNLKDKAQPYFFLAALSVDEKNIMGAQSAIKIISSKYFPHEFDRVDFEFHGVEIRKGKGIYKKLSVEKRIELIKELLSVLKNYDIDVFTVGINKSKYWSNIHPHQAAFVLLVERLNKYLGNDCYGLLICDENKEIEQPIINDLSRFQEYSTNFGYKSVKIDKIIDSVHFVKSHNNPLIQLSDLVAYFTNRCKIILERYNTWDMEQVKINGTNSEKADFEIYSLIKSSIKQSKMFP